MIQFCNAVNSGSEYGANTLNYLLRLRDREKPVFSLPDVPEQFRSYLLESPIECHITQIKSLPTASDDSKELLCRIDAGRNTGLTTDMELYLSVEDSFEWQVDVEEILADSSRVRVSKWLNLPTDYFPQVGDLLSTRRYWNNRSRPMYDYSDPATRKFLLEYYGPSALEGHDCGIHRVGERRQANTRAVLDAAGQTAGLGGRAKAALGRTCEARAR